MDKPKDLTVDDDSAAESSPQEEVVADRESPLSDSSPITHETINRMHEAEERNDTDGFAVSVEIIAAKVEGRRPNEDTDQESYAENEKDEKEVVRNGGHDDIDQEDKDTEGRHDPVSECHDGVQIISNQQFMAVEYVEERQPPVCIPGRTLDEFKQAAIEVKGSEPQDTGFPAAVQNDNDQNVLPIPVNDTRPLEAAFIESIEGRKPSQTDLPKTVEENIDPDAKPVENESRLLPVRDFANGDQDDIEHEVIVEDQITEPKTEIDEYTIQEISKTESTNEVDESIAQEALITGLTTGLKEDTVHDAQTKESTNGVDKDTTQKVPLRANRGEENYVREVPILDSRFGKKIGIIHIAPVGEPTNRNEDNTIYEVPLKEVADRVEKDTVCEVSIRESTNRGEEDISHEIPVRETGNTVEKSTIHEDATKESTNRVEKSAIHDVPIRETTNRAIHEVPINRVEESPIHEVPTRETTDSVKEGTVNELPINRVEENPIHEVPIRETTDRVEEGTVNEVPINIGEEGVIHNVAIRASTDRIVEGNIHETPISESTNRVEAGTVQETSTAGTEIQTNQAEGSYSVERRKLRWGEAVQRRKKRDRRINERGNNRHNRRIIIRRSNNRRDRQVTSENQGNRDTTRFEMRRSRNHIRSLCRRSRGIQRINPARPAGYAQFRLRQIIREQIRTGSDNDPNTERTSPTEDDTSIHTAHLMPNSPHNENDTVSISTISTMTTQNHDFDTTTNTIPSTSSETLSHSEETWLHFPYDLTQHKSDFIPEAKDDKGKKPASAVGKRKRLKLDDQPCTSKSVDEADQLYQSVPEGPALWTATESRNVYSPDQPSTSKAADEYDERCRLALVSSRSSSELGSIKRKYEDDSDGYEASSEEDDDDSYINDCAVNNYHQVSRSDQAHTAPKKRKLSRVRGTCGAEDVGQARIYRKRKRGEDNDSSDSENDRSKRRKS